MYHNRKPCFTSKQGLFYLFDVMGMFGAVGTREGFFLQPLPPLASVANEGFAPLCGATAIPMAALKTPVAPKGRELGKPNEKKSRRDEIRIASQFIGW